MSSDEGRFSSFLLYECYFPSLLQKKLIRLGIAFDRRFLGGFLAKRVGDWEERRYGAHRHMHAMGLTIPEEDDITFYYSMASGFWITKMPYMGDLDFYHMNDWPAAKRRRYNDFYRECVRRQLYLNGPHKTHLAKNPLWAGRVASLVEAFPDAKFVVNIRDPRDTIPSLLSLVRAGWKQLGWEEARQRRCLQILANQSWSSYRHPLETLEAHPETKGAVVDYQPVVTYRRPGEDATRVYRGTRRHYVVGPPEGAEITLRVFPDPFYAEFGNALVVPVDSERILEIRLIGNHTMAYEVTFHSNRPSAFVV